jgi:CheY-like chemotaxis protein
VLGVLSALPNVNVTQVENGAQALKEASGGSYSLLISDVEMPVMNGVQLLRVLRSQFSRSELPIIMLTQVGQPEHKARAFADGANDYVTKPVEPLELLARARAQLELRELHRTNLANQAFSLHAQKLAAVAQLSATLAHELNTPAQYLGDNLEFLSQSLGDLDRFHQEHAHELPDDLAALRAEIPACLRDLTEGVQRVVRLVQNIAEFSDAEAQRGNRVDVERSINTVVELLRSRWLGVVELTTHHGAKIRNVSCAPTDLKHALWQVIAQAIDDAALPGAVKGRVDIATQLAGEQVAISVRAARGKREEGVKTLPAPAKDALHVTRTVLHQYQAELTRTVDPDGSVTSVIKLAV